ncbi:hypothetical protein SPRG_02441 [Saprolegnia parasitica CBS 223.65]|uniref:Uncharacterized protein n=1 Tax=Saprolegnia parasitica (strain CBS 223.65) TaxID=695850 RepID=A0A067CQI6_SAPPC|nr:hypothetical protein SPRG_02441 [Saprolegnia parasitica CBS 223.65]KDO32743.1 hypothetical protein SPRG_02441 [Saprolegnia parasitica CBS 223.65]|eukprot:XP_012196407.1 hypothetical protein SPRG_02441 [Saprolegnia parasitica CBS 223.65]
MPGLLYSTGLLLNGDDYRVAVHDVEPAGVVVVATQTSKNVVFSRAFTKQELTAAGLTKSPLDCARLAESLLFVVSPTQEPQLHSTLPGVRQPEPIASGAAAEVYLTTTRVGTETFLDVLQRGLIVLCKEKPMGLNAVAMLGTWLLEHNPSQPLVSRSSS